MPSDSVYLPVHVGAEGKASIGFTPDNSGDNISSENATFSELTGLYWGWKNLTCDYLGFVHYRRYFAPHRIFGTASIDDILTREQILSITSQHKIILPKRRRYYIETLYSHYAHTADKKHLDAVREIIRSDCPAYLESFDAVMGRTWGWMFNMFIMPKSVADEYCSWLFPILFRLRKIIGIDGLSAFEMRYPARTAELMFNVWLEDQAATGSINPEEVCEIPYVYTAPINWFRKASGFLMAKFFHRRYTRSF